LPQNGGLFASNVIVLRDEKYTFLPPEQSFFVSVITVPQPKEPEYHAKKDELTSTSQKHVINTIRTLFNVARENGIQSIILKAWGDRHIAELFKIVIAHDGWNKIFTEIVFSIVPNDVSPLAKHVAQTNALYKTFASSFEVEQ